MIVQVVVTVFRWIKVQRLVQKYDINMKMAVLDSGGVGLQASVTPSEKTACCGWCWILDDRGCLLETMMPHVDAVDGGERCACGEPVE